MAGGNGAVFVKKKHTHGLAHDIASADYHTVFAFDFNIAFCNKLHNACRCAGHKIIIANHNFANIYRVKGVNILFGADGVDNGFFIKVFGKRKLN